MRSLVDEAGFSRQFELDSAGTGDWHVGHPPDERATAAASARGYELVGSARQIEGEELGAFDYVVAMDRQNHAHLAEMAAREGVETQVVLLREFDSDAAEAGRLDVPDPYYGGEEGFEHVLDVIEVGCAGLLRRIVTERHMLPSDGDA